MVGLKAQPDDRAEAFEEPSEHESISSGPPETIDDSRVIRGIQQYREALERGDRPDREEILGRYPALAGELAACLDTLDFVHQVAPQFRGESADAEPGLPRSGLITPLATLGDFRIVREIGRGGMGVVYEATQLSLNRRVALKVLPFVAVLDPRQLQRFKNEAQAAASLKHPNILDVYAVGCERGVHYYAMEYVEGQTLAQVIDQLRGESEVRGRASTVTEQDGDGSSTSAQPEVGDSQAAPAADRDRCGQTPLSGGSNGTREFFCNVTNLGIQAAEALEHAHQMGVVHRDIKPSNLMVDAQGHLWITDFGLAMTQTSPHLTMTGDIVGTLRYMSPEQAAGKGQVLDHHTDIYSLGLTLYELLTLEPAFAGDDRQKLVRQVLEDDPRPLRQWNKAVPKDLETILLKATAKQRGSRYATAQELADDLRRFLADKPIRAKRPSLVDRATKWTRRHRPLVWASAATVLVAVAALTVNSLMLARAYDREKAQRQKALTQQRLAKQQQHRAEGREMAVRRVLYAAHMKLAYEAWQRGSYDRLMQLVERYLPAAGQEDLRRFEWYYLWGLCHQELHVLNDYAVSLAFSPDGKMLAVPASHEGLIRLWDPKTGRVLRVFEGHRGWTNCVAFSPDGRTLASGGGSNDEPGELILWHVATGQPLASLDAGPVGIWTLAFSPDGKTLVTGSSGGYDAKKLPGEVTLWDVATRQRRLTLPKREWGVSSVAFAPDGQTIASGCWKGEVVLWDAAEGKERLTLKPSNSDVLHQFLAFSPNGNTLALASSGGIELWDTRTRTHQGTLSGDTSMQIAFSPVGGMLAACTGGTVDLWNVATQKKTATFIGHTNWTWGVAFSPDGKILASAGRDQTVRLWDVTTTADRLPKERALSSGSLHPTGRSAMALAGNGQMMALLTEDNHVLLWDTLTGQERIRLSGIADPVCSVAFSPDSDTLATASASEGNHGMIQLWDVATGQERKRLAKPGSYSVVVFSPDGKQVAAACGKSVMVWDIASGTYRTILEGREGPISCLAFSPTGQMLAAGSIEWHHSGTIGAFPGEVRLWDLLTGQLVRRFEYILNVFEVTFSPDGTTLAVGGGNIFENRGSRGNIQLWDVETGHELAYFTAHTRNVRGVAFSPDGKTLATASHDGSVKLWETNEWEERVALDWNDQKIDRVVFSTDGQTLAASTIDGNVKLWRTPRAEEVERYRWLVWSHEGKERAGRQQWNEAVTSYTKAIELRPDNWRCWYERGKANAELQDWTQAAADFSKAIDLRSTSAHVWYFLALVHLMRGDTAAFQRTCADMLQRLGDTNNLRAAHTVAWTCSLAPNGVGDLATPLALATKAAEAKASDFSCEQTVGAILYRAGRFEEALQHLEKAEQLAGDFPGDEHELWTPVTGWFYLAMAHYRLGQEQQARLALDKAVHRSETRLREHHNRTGPTVPWYLRAAYQLSRRETELLVNACSRPRTAQRVTTKGKKDTYRVETRD